MLSYHDNPSARQEILEELKRHCEDYLSEAAACLAEAAACDAKLKNFINDPSLYAAGFVVGATADDVEVSTRAARDAYIAEAHAHAARASARAAYMKMVHKIISLLEDV